MPGVELVDLSRPRSIHVVGLGGSGMSAIAEVLTTMGHRISGSDQRPSPVLDRLRGLGVDARVGHHAANVEAGIDALAVSTAIGADNPEVQAARRSGIPVLRRADVLAALTRRRRTIAIAGTHGKTTTSALLSCALADAGLDPSFVVGGEIAEFGTGARWGSGEWLVVEADESDGTFLDLEVEIAVVTSVEPDHLEHYGGFDALVDAFSLFLSGASAHLVCADDPTAARLGAACSAATYGFEAAADLRVADYAASRSATSFTLVGDGSELGRVQVPLPGRHNARNATAAIGAALRVGATFAAAAAGVAGFAGVGRRSQVRGERAGVTYVDDYAHLPGEVAPTLAAAREGGWHRVVCVFQPHRYSRTEALWADFADAFADADVVVVTEIYAAGEPARPGVSGRLVADAVRDAHPAARVEWIPERADLVTFLRGEFRDGDLCLTLGAGDLTTLPDELLGVSGDSPEIAAAAAVLGDRARRDVLLGPFTTYGVGGPAALLLELSGPADLALARRAVAASGVPVLVVGRGSNLLVADRGFPGLVVTLGPGFAAIEVVDRAGGGSGSQMVRAGGAVSLPVLARRTAALGLRGLEWAVGVPGSVGGAVRMNAGGHGSDVRAHLTRAWLFDLGADAGAAGTVEVAAGELTLGYRASAVTSLQVVTAAEFGLVVGDRAEAETDIAEVVRWRREHQPGGANAGSVFANPVGDSAGRLIDAAGLRGHRRGSAFVSPKHANFVQVDKGGAADDVRVLLEEVRETVKGRFGIVLALENRLVGFDPSPLSRG